MDRRSFIIRSAALSAGLVATGGVSLLGSDTLVDTNGKRRANIYTTFKNPDAKYHPFVRWWWNGNKVEKK